MDIRPFPKSSEGANPNNSPDERAMEHIRAIAQGFVPEIQDMIGGKKSQQTMTSVIEQMKHHVDELERLETQLTNMQAQLGVPKLANAYTALKKTPNNETLSAFAREAYLIGTEFNIHECQIALHIDELKQACQMLGKAVEKGHPSEIMAMRNLTNTLMNNLRTLKIENNSQYSNRITQLGQNHLIFDSKASLSKTDIDRWNRALNEFYRFVA